MAKTAYGPHVKVVPRGCKGASTGEPIVVSLQAWLLCQCRTTNEGCPRCGQVYRAVEKRFGNCNEC